MRPLSIASIMLACFSLSQARALPRRNQSQLPIVDIGYELHQALSYNDTYDYYQFSNIRYAQPPIGDLRFRAPLPPVVDRSVVHNGSETRICPQGVPDWQTKAFTPVTEFDLGKPYSLAAWEAAIANSTVLDLPLNDQTSEDCLFLDVFVPPKVLEKAYTSRSESRRGAPVLVWIHGGGWVLGSKTGFLGYGYDPSGLVQHGNEENADGMVYVALNYRLGALGFLAGEDVKNDGVLNAGLLDNRMALEWVQKNIHLFGGDASRVTIMGESAGGGNVLLQMTAYGGAKGPVPFSQAILQSPGKFPVFNELQEAHDGFFRHLNVSSISEARQVSSETIIAANAAIIKEAPYTTYYYNPVLDGSFIPAPPEKLFSKGSYDKKVTALTGVNSFEGSFFYDPSATTEDEIRAFVEVLVPYINEEGIDKVTKELYPPIFDGSEGYVDQDTRQSSMTSEAVIYCSAEMVNEALGDNSYAYEFSVSPGVHIQDLSYTFFDHTLPAPIPAPEAQVAIQRAITSFTVHSVPKIYHQSGSDNCTASSSVDVPRWNPQTRPALNITATGAELGTKVRSPKLAERCRFWGKDVFQYVSSPSQ